VVERSIPPRISTLASIMRVDATTVVVTRALRDAGVRPILLKGPSIALWLYDAKEARPYTDSDLLVSPTDLPAAEEVLRTLGFTPYVTQSGTDRKLRPHHALPWEPPPHLGTTVDLHQSIGDVEGDPATVWRALSKDTEELQVAGERVEVLGIPARVLHVALHAAHHSGGFAPALEDLRRAIATASPEHWRAAARIAAEIGGAAELSYALGLVPGGERVRHELSLAEGAPADAILRQAGTPPLARTLNWISGQRRMRDRAGLALAAVFPSPPEMRDWSALARRGRIGLMLAYVGRPFWVLARLPRGWAAARRARRRGERTDAR